MSLTDRTGEGESSSFAENPVAVVHIENPDLPLEETQVRRYSSLGESIQQVESNCAYTVAHTLPGRRVIRFDRHLKRLFESAEGLGYEAGVDATSVRRLLSEVLDHYGGAERSKFRITLLRDGGILIAVEPYAGLPEELRVHGIDCALVPNSARGRPDTKTTSWMDTRRSLTDRTRRSLTDRNVYEVLLSDDNGYVLEGSSSNVFFVAGKAHEPCLRTAEEGILKGVTRAIVLELVEPEMQVQRSAVHYTELESIQEAFICSSTRGIVPIRRIDDIHYPAPGAWTSRISTLYDEWVEHNSEPLLK